MRFFKNSGINAGGIFLNHSLVNLSEIEFINNRANQGAGIFKIGNEDIDYIDVIFENNVALRGAAI